MLNDFININWWKILLVISLSIVSIHILKILLTEFSCSGNAYKKIKKTVSLNLEKNTFNCRIDADGLSLEHIKYILKNWSNIYETTIIDRDVNVKHYQGFCGNDYVKYEGFYEIYFYKKEKKNECE